MHSRPVILLHGLGRTAASMWLLSRRLRAAGFQTTALDYPSTRLSLADNCAYVHDALANLYPDGPLDLVGHSMGGIIARHLCTSQNNLEIQRVVQIGSPNLGSALADRMGPFWAVRRACGPSIQDLREIGGPLPRDPRITAIASSGGCRNPLGLLKGPHDGAVTVRSAWAGAGKRHRVRSLHTLMPLSNEVARITIAALQA